MHLFIFISIFIFNYDFYVHLLNIILILLSHSNLPSVDCLLIIIDFIIEMSGMHFMITKNYYLEYIIDI